MVHRPPLSSAPTLVLFPVALSTDSFDFILCRPKTLQSHSALTVPTLSSVAPKTLQSHSALTVPTLSSIAPKTLQLHSGSFRSSQILFFFLSQVLNSIKMSSINNVVDEDENSQRLQLQLRPDIVDPYIFHMGSTRVKEDQPSSGEIKPFIGMEFRTWEEAFMHYNSYAYHMGFSVRKVSTGRNKHGVSSMRFVCNKEGFSNWKKNLESPIGSSTTRSTPEKQKGMTRIDCKASCRIRLVEGGIWRVSVFKENHNHVLITSPSKKRNMRSHKRMTANDKEIIRDLSSQNIGTSQILEYVAIQHRGKQNVRFRKKDVSNLIVAENRKLNGIDVHTTMLYFQKRQEEDPEFFHCIDADESGVVNNIFWVDGRARRAYQEFGDVVTFDTTYQTNKYNMPLFLDPPRAQCKGRKKKATRFVPAAIKKARKMRTCSMWSQREAQCKNLSKESTRG